MWPSRFSTKPVGGSDWCKSVGIAILFPVLVVRCGIAHGENESSIAEFRCAMQMFDAKKMHLMWSRAVVHALVQFMRFSFSLWDELGGLILRGIPYLLLRMLRRGITKWFADSYIPTAVFGLKKTKLGLNSEVLAPLNLWESWKSGIPILWITSFA